MRRLLFLLVFLCAAIQAHAASYYLDCLQGVDSNNGQSQAPGATGVGPWLSLGNLNLNGFNGGDIISLKGGCVYRNTILGNWVANNPYLRFQVILDSNNNLQEVTKTGAGTSGGTTPTWNATSGGTTTDGGVTWINLSNDNYALNISQPGSSPSPSASAPVIFTSYGDGPAWISGDLCAGLDTGNCAGATNPNWTSWAVATGSIYKTSWPLRPYAVYIDNETAWPTLRAATCETGTCTSVGVDGNTYPAGGLSEWKASLAVTSGQAVHAESGADGGITTPATFADPFWFTAGSTGTTGATPINCGGIGSSCSDGTITWTAQGLSLGEILAMQPGSWFWDGTYLYIWMPDNSSPVNHVVEVVDKYSGIQLSAHGSERNYVQFEHLAVRHSCNGFYLVSAGTANAYFAGIVVANNIVTQTGTGRVDDGEFCSGIVYAQTSSATSGQAAPTTSPQFLRNTISYTGSHGAGMTLQQAGGALIDGNDLSHGAHAEINIVPPGGQVTNGVTIQRNVIHDMQMLAFNKALPAPHATIDSNLGIYLQSPGTINILDNWVYNIDDSALCVNAGTCSAVQLFAQSGTVNIAHNRFVNVFTGVYQSDGTTSNALNVTDNVIVPTSPAPNTLSYPYIIDPNLTGSGSTIDRNHITLNNNSKAANYQSSTQTWAQWQTAGFDTNGTDTNWQSYLSPLEQQFLAAAQRQSVAPVVAPLYGGGAQGSLTATIPGNTLATHNYANSINSSGTISGQRPVCGDLSNAQPSCSTDTTNATNITSGTLPSAQLPNPTSSNIGGVKSFASVSHQYLNSISTGGAPASARPQWGDLSSATSPLEDAPVWLHFLGTGAESDPQVVTNADCTGSGAPTACCTGVGTGSCTGAQTLQGEHWYANFTVSASSTATIGNVGSTNSTPHDYPRAALEVHSPGTCTIAGTIAGNALLTAGGSGGGGGGGGGGGSGAGGSNGNASQGLGSGGANLQISPGGTGGATGANAGTACSATISTATKEWQSQWLNMFAICGGGAGGAGGSSGGAAGNGGGCLILDCATINFTGTINLNGGNGGAGGSGTGGGGGGGGGALIEAAQTYTANTGTVNLAGGNAGTGATGSAGNGASGCNGWQETFTLN